MKTVEFIGVVTIKSVTYQPGDTLEVDDDLLSKLKELGVVKGNVVHRQAVDPEHPTDLVPTTNSTSKRKPRVSRS